MKQWAVLAALLSVVAGLVADCNQGNCTKSKISLFDFVFSNSNIELIHDLSDDTISDLSDDTIEPLLPKDDSSAEGDVLSFNILKVFAFSDDSGSSEELNDPGVQLLFNSKIIIGDFGVLDLSGRNLTGEDVAEELRSRQLSGQPIYSLVLSNARIHGLSIDTFQPVEDTLTELHMDNCSVSLDAFHQLSNLRVWNLSNTGLNIFGWYPLLKNTLEVLDLSHNKLMEVRPEISQLQSLRHLDLSYNRIRTVNEYPLTLLPYLEVVSFTMNSLDNATFTTLTNLVQVDLDWNYLWKFGYDVQLPPYRLAVKLASNPWRCDCGIITAKDSYDVLDIDILRCNTHSAFRLCYYDSCLRTFLPEEEGNIVANLTKKSINYLGCTGLADQWQLFREGLTRLKENQPEKYLQLELLLLIIVFVLIYCLFLRNSCTKKKFDRQAWLKIQQIPFLNKNELKKPQEVPYIKIDDTEKA